MNPKLRETSYLYLPGFITVRRAEQLAQEFYSWERQGLCTRDRQAPNSPAAYNFLPFVRLLVEKVSAVSELCGEPVLPTYAYARIYTHGEILARHRDRDACEVSLTLNLVQDREWPIYIQKPDGRAVDLITGPGDAVMYFGCEADHWRERFNGRNYVQVFIHYVRAFGPRAYAFFDKANAPAAVQHPEVAIAEKPQPLARDMRKVGRNDACPCGSGKKYKHCHGRPN